MSQLAGAMQVKVEHSIYLQLQKEFIKGTKKKKKTPALNWDLAEMLVNNHDMIE